MLPAVVIATSTISPLMMRLLISAGGARMIAILCSLVRSKAPASSVSNAVHRSARQHLNFGGIGSSRLLANAIAKPIVPIIRDK